MPPGIIAVAHQQVSFPAVDSGDVPLEIFAINIQNTANPESHRGAGGIVIIPYLAAAIGLEDHLASLQHIAGGGAVHGLRSPYPVGIVAETDGIRSVVRCSRLPAMSRVLSFQGAT